MSSDFVLWSHEDIANALVLKKLIGVENAAQRIKLQSAGHFSDGEIGELAFEADPDFPDDLLLTDCHGNTAGLITLSPKLKTFLQKKDLPNIEFIPVKFLNHKGKVAAEYFILHPTLSIDCLNWDASEAKVSLLNKDRIQSIESIVVHPEKIPDNAIVFKIRALNATTVIRRSLAKEITKAGFKGMDWEELDEYSS